MFHYTSCGLQNIYLVNGYQCHETAYGKGTSIDDLEGLHLVIAIRLIEYKPLLSGGEFRFLRKELDMSQKRIGELLGKTEQAVAIWEKKGNIPKYADRFVRIIYREFTEGNAKIISVIDRLNHMDRKSAEKLVFEETNRGWKTAA